MRLLLLLLLLFAPPLAAQTVEVRSGEHDTFTRLVFYLPDGVTGSLESGGEDPVVRLSRAGLRFDTGGVFARIPRTRLTDLLPVAGSGLALALACDCPVTLQREGARLLVVDISDGPARSAATPPSATRPQLRFGTVSPGAEVPMTTVRDRPAAPRQVPTPEAFPPEDAASAVARAERVSEAERALLQQIARAATQGLLDPVALARSRPTPTPEASVIPSAPPPGLPGEEEPQVAAESSVDQALRDVEGAPRMTADGEACLPDRSFDVASWASTGPFGSQLGALRVAAYGDVGRPDPEALTALARFYIHYGFGAEALEALSRIEAEQVALSSLRDMARILEMGQTGAPSVLDGQADCDGAVALWSVLASAVPVRGAGINAAAVQRTLLALPEALRRYLGPILSERLLLSGEEDLARQVLRLSAIGPAPPEADLAAARVDLVTGQTAPAEARLARAANAGGEASPEALATLLETQLSSGTEIDPVRIEEAAAYATQLRGQPLGARLKRAEIRALAANGRYETAFEELARAEAVISAAERQELLSDIALGLAARAGDVSLLDVALSRLTLVAGELAPEAGNAVAERLLALGFPEEAASFLAMGAEGVEGRDRRLLRARAALALERPRRAQADLLGLSGPDVEVLKAEAEALLGNHEAASDGFDALDDAAGAARQAWLAGDWQRLRASEDPVLSDLANLVRSETEPVARPERGPGGGLPDGTLAQNRMLLQSSGAARETLEKLLESVEMSGALEAPQQ